MGQPDQGRGQTRGLYMLLALSSDYPPQPVPGQVSFPNDGRPEAMNQFVLNETLD